MEIGRSISVGVDGTPEARDAAVLGRRIARAAGGRVHFVAPATHVLTDVMATRAGVDLDQIHQAVLEDARRAAQDGLTEAFQPPELAEALTTRLGRVEFALAEHAREVDADLIVLGGRVEGGSMSRGARGAAKHLARMRIAPVVVTGPNGPDVERVLVAVDVSAAAPPTIAAAAALARLLDVPLEAVHVAVHPVLPHELDLGLDESSVVREQEEEAVAELWPLLPEGAGRRIARGDVEEEIFEAACEGPPTLLVVGAQGSDWLHRLLLGSTAEELLENPPCTLAVVPVDMEEES